MSKELADSIKRLRENEIMRSALIKIANGTRNSEWTARDALYECGCLMQGLNYTKLNADGSPVSKADALLEGLK